MIKDPVFLSGGNLGGTVVEGEGWEVGTEKEFDGLIYRRISDDSRDDTEDSAVFVGTV